MMSSFNFKRVWLIAGGTLLGSLATLLAVRAGAAGIPAAGALTYTGYLESPDGKPVTTAVNVTLNVWDATVKGNKVCDVVTENLLPVSGRFQIQLPEECTVAVKAKPDLWVEAVLDGASLGRTKLGAVPYAVEANHATSATAADAAAKADLATKATNSDHAKSVDIVVVTMSSADLAGDDGWIAKCIAAPQTWFPCQIAAGRICGKKGYSTGWFGGEGFNQIICLR